MSQVTGFGYSVGPVNRKRPKMDVSTLLGFVEVAKRPRNKKISCVGMRKTCTGVGSSSARVLEY